MRQKLIKISVVAVCISVLLLCFLPYGFASEYPRAVFENERTNDVFLEVQKAVSVPNGVTLSEADKNREFEFTLLSGTSPVSEAEYELYNVVDGQLERVENDSIHHTSAAGIFNLKADTVARFTNLRSGTSYTVKETGNKGHFVQSYPAADGEYSLILGNKSERIGFVNTYVQPEPGKLRIKKTVSIPAGYVFEANDRFTFELKTDGEPYANKEFELQDSSGTRVGNGTTDGNGRFSMEADRTACFTFEEAVDYDVREILGTGNISRGWRIVGEERFQGTTAEKSDVEFVNTNASFIVKKTLTSGTSEQQFVFTVTNHSGLPLWGQKYYIYDIDGTPKDDLTQLPRSTDESGRFTLKAGEAAYFVGITPGTKLTLTEEVNPGFEIKFPVDGVYRDWTVPQRAVVLPFENEPISASGVLQVMKTVKDFLPNEAAPSDKSFTFTLQKQVTVINGGVPEVQWQAVAHTAYRIGTNHYLTDNDGKFALKKNETAMFDALAVDTTYRIVEDDITGLAAYKDVHLDKTGYARGTVTEGELTEDKILSFNYVNLYKPKMVDLELTKTDRIDLQPLKGAVFALFADEALTIPLYESPPSDVNGIIRIENLHTGTYYLAEQTAPFGYYITDKPFKIVVEKTVTTVDGVENFDMDVHIYDGDGNELDKTHQVNGEKDSDGVYILNDIIRFDVPNRSSTEMSAAGGYKLWMYIGGSFMLFMACAMLARNYFLCGKTVKRKTRLKSRKLDLSDDFWQGDNI